MRICNPQLYYTGIANPREPKSREPKAFQADSFRFRFRLRVFLSAVILHGELYYTGIANPREPKCSP